MDTCGFFMVVGALALVSGCAVIDDDDASEDPTTQQHALKPSAQSSITLEGRAFSPITQQPVDGATVEVYRKQGNKFLGSTTTGGGNGEYSITLPTKNGKALDVYLVSSAPGFTTTRLFPPNPIDEDVEVCPPFAGTIGCLSLAMLRPSDKSFVASQAGVTQQPNKAELLLIAADCDGQPKPGLTVRVRPKAGGVFYANGPFPDPSLTETDAFGRVFSYNIRPGKVHVQTRLNGKLYGKITVDAEAGESTIASALPKNCPK